MSVEQRERIWRRFAGDPNAPLLVSIHENRISGFCHVSPSRDSDTHNAAEIIALYIDPRHWRKGIGHALCGSALAFARDRGFSLVTLWTLSTNYSAQRFYEFLGFHPDGASKREDMLGFTLDEVRYSFRIKQGEQVGAANRLKPVADQ
jgi:GNAT superfamily N-acetyltransferase